MDDWETPFHIVYMYIRGFLCLYSKWCHSISLKDSVHVLLLIQCSIHTG